MTFGVEQVLWGVTGLLVLAVLRSWQKGRAPASVAPGASQGPSVGTAEWLASRYPLEVLSTATVLAARAVKAKQQDPTVQGKQLADNVLASLG